MAGKEAEQESRMLARRSLFSASSCSSTRPHERLLQRLTVHVTTTLALGDRGTLKFSRPEGAFEVVDTKQRFYRRVKP